MWRTLYVGARKDFATTVARLRRRYFRLVPRWSRFGAQAMQRYVSWHSSVCYFYNFYFFKGLFFNFYFFFFFFVFFSFLSSVVVVGVNGDETTLKNKGPVVLKESVRYESVRNCKWCDEVVENAPWIITKDFMDEHKIDYVIHDPAPYPSKDGKIADVYGPIKDADRFVASKRTDGISTTDIIVSIIKDYDLYVLRNYRRGVSFADMNVHVIDRLAFRYDMLAEDRPVLARVLFVGAITVTGLAARFIYEALKK